MVDARAGELQQPYDVIVVGGGAAGLSGALALARARRSVLVIDAGDPRNAPADGVHNYLSRDGISPGSLLSAGRAEVTGYGAKIVTGTVVAARRSAGSLDDAAVGFVVELADGGAFQARRLLVTTGLVDELPSVPGLAQRWGRDVVHCPYCHGWEVRDQAIGVLSTGPMSVHQALLWRQWSADIALFLHTGPEPTDEQREQLAARGVAVVSGEVAALEVHDDQLTGVRLKNGRTIARQALAVAPRFTARAEVLADLGVQPSEHRLGDHVIGSFVAGDPTGATDVPGLWVAGNVADPMAQVISSAAAGLTAGAAINADLVAEDTAAEVSRLTAAYGR